MSEDAEAPGDIVAAIKFDDHAAYLIRVATEVAALSRRGLRLVHICGALAAPAGDLAGDGGDAGPRAATPDDEDGQDDPLVETCRRRLGEMAKTHGAGGVRTHINVVAGDFPGTLIEHAMDRAASLVIAGASLLHPGVLRAKLRQTYRLMATSAIPVLVLPDARTPLTIGKRPLRLLLADDLTPTSLRAVHAASELIALLRVATDVLHLHVEAPSAGGLGLSGGGEAEAWPGISVADRLLNDRHEELRRRLRVRARGLRRQLQRLGGTYATQLWHGNVSKEISRAAQVHAADICVFGRHQFFHRQALTLGQMRFASMLGVEGAILVAP